MKKLTLLATLLFTIALSNLHAQSLQFKPEPELNKFVGTWIGEQGGKKLKLIFKKTKMKVKESSIDILEGYHILTVNDKTIENTGEVTFKNGSHFSLQAIDNDTSTVYFIFEDITKQKIGEARIKMMPGNLNQITLRLTNRETIYTPDINNKKPFDKEFTIPRVITLKRQEN